MTPSDVENLRALSHEKKVGAVIAPNFALGAVLMIHFAKMAAKYFDYAEIIELHHEKKADAPSGTALTSARAMALAKGRKFKSPKTTRETLKEVRGGEMDGIHIHSVRLPGLVAHQEIILGGQGQTLTIRHDSVSRESFMPGVLLAVKEVVKYDKLIYGLEELLGL